jgi:hypothetical protein
LTSSSSSASSSAPQVVAKASESGSVLNGALGDYAVLDSACSHRPVFKALALRSSTGGRFICEDD